MPNSDVIIVGGGPAGLTAALVAARRGRRVVLLERMQQPGLKLRLTGKGRCNLTNMAPMAEFLPHIGPDARFMRNAFGQFFNKELVKFIEELGVPLTEERGGRIFPESGKSVDVFLALVKAIEALPSAEIRRNSRVESLLIDAADNADARQLRGVALQGGARVMADRVLLATGGITYPSTGSTGDGYRLAAQAGHHVIEPVPALTPLTCREPIPPAMTGLVLRNVTLSISNASGKKLFEHFGEMTFTDDGIAGPIAIAASRHAVRPLHSGETLKAHIDLKPAIPADELDRRLIRDLNSNGTRLFHDALRLWLPAELTDFALQRLKIAKFKRLHQITGEERRKLLMFLKNAEFTITGHHDENESIITQGGVDTREVNPKSMESKLLEGLYIAGELLNLDADTGGFNLQIAFSTGYAAGMAV